MEYITVHEAAQKWKISERLTQQYCTEGRVQGAEKFGGVWAIPADAKKPEDSRRGRKPAELKPPAPQSAPSVPTAHLIPMPLMNSPFAPGHCLEYVEGIEDVRLRDIARAEYNYFSGRPEEATQMAELYLSYPDLSLRLSACLIYAYSNLSIGQIQRARYALTEVRNTLKDADESMPPQLRAAAFFTVTTAAVLLHLPLPEGIGHLQDYLRLLPPGLRMFALYVQAHYTYLQGDYGKSIGIVETALACRQRSFPSPPSTCTWRP